MTILADIGSSLIRRVIWKKNDSIRDIIVKRFVFLRMTKTSLLSNNFFFVAYFPEINKPKVHCEGKHPNIFNS